MEEDIRNLREQKKNNNNSSYYDKDEEIKIHFLDDDNSIKQNNNKKLDNSRNYKKDLRNFNTISYNDNSKRNK